MLSWKVVSSSSHDCTRERKNYAIRVDTILETFPAARECCLIDVSVNPVAILKVIHDQAVNNLDSGKKTEKVTVIFWGKSSKIVRGFIDRVRSGIR